MTPARANSLALVAAMGWGMGNVAQKGILENLDGFTATGITSILGALVLLPLVRRETGRLESRQKGAFILLVKVSVMFTLATTLAQFGFGHTTVTNAGFLINTAAAMTPILAWACLKQRLPGRTWLASLCAVMGAFLMAGAHCDGLTFGDGLCLLSALSYALWTLWVSDYVVQFRRPILMTVVQLAICGVGCSAVGAIGYGFAKADDLAAALPEIVMLGVISKGLAFVLLATAQQHVSAACAAVLGSAEAIFGALAALILLGETMSAARMLGAGCITLGLVLAAWVPSQAKSVAA